MTIAYNLGIPNSPNNPSTDQPNMKTNNDNIATYVAVDHVGFNTSGSGQHNQVTFNANNVPTTPTSPPVLFTNNVLTVPQLFFYSGPTFNQYSAVAGGATGGSAFLLGGIILKWGTLNAPDNTAIQISTYAGSVFPNNCFAVYPVIIKSNTSNPINVTVSNISDKDHFTLRISFQTGGTTSSNIYFLAIGN